jgi:hypothetical protein
MMRTLAPMAATALLTISAMAAASPAHAQMSPPVVETKSRNLTAAERASAIDAVLTTLDAQYVFPERRPAMREAVRAAQSEGRYDTADPVVFAKRLSEDLSRSGQDGHLYVRYDPDQFAAAKRKPANGEDSAELEALWATRYRAANYGLTEQRVLPGNVRYLKISMFGWVNDETGSAYDAAMRFLEGGEAVIIDLRGNGGGAHDAVRYALSHFMKPDELLITFLEAGEPPYASRTLTYLPSGRMLGKPLYVLIDGKVASAGEEFAYSVQQFRLGTLIGQTTAGGANTNRFEPIAPGFMLSVSYGAPEHPASGGNWEGVGVKPDVEVPADQALERAQAMAREKLAPSAKP